jgi:hypothetical protein
LTVSEPSTTETCTSRRNVLKGASAVALATAALRMRPVLAEDGTPVATPAGGDDAPPSWLFTQTFREGDWAPTDDPTLFTLRLRGGLLATIGFTDRPHRDFGVTCTADLIPILWDNPDNPPNAAIIVEDAAIQYTFLLVLTDPSYDKAADQITYTVRVLESYEGDGLGEVVARVADGTLPQTFGAGALFIDSAFACAESKQMYCTRSGGTEFLEISARVTEACGWFCARPCEKDAWDTWCNTTFDEWCFAGGNTRGCRFASAAARESSCG